MLGPTGHTLSVVADTAAADAIIQAHGGWRLPSPSGAEVREGRAEARRALVGSLPGSSDLYHRNEDWPDRPTVTAGEVAPEIIDEFVCVCDPERLAAADAMREVVRRILEAGTEEWGPGPVTDGVFLTSAAAYLGENGAHIAEIATDQWSLVEVVCRRYDVEARQSVLTLVLRVQCDRVEDGVARAVQLIAERAASLVRQPDLPRQVRLPAGGPHLGAQAGRAAMVPSARRPSPRALAVAHHWTVASGIAGNAERQLVLAA